MCFLLILCDLYLYEYSFSVIITYRLLVHGQVTIIFVVSVGLSVCLFVCAEFCFFCFCLYVKLGHMLYVWI